MTRHPGFADGLRDKAPHGPEPKAPRRPLRCRLGWHQIIPILHPQPDPHPVRVGLSCARCPWQDRNTGTRQFADAPTDPPSPPRGPAAASPTRGLVLDPSTSNVTTGRRPMPHLLGRPVWFRSRTGRWTAPAFVTATTASLYRPNVDAGHLRPLTSDRHVHLIVLTAGLQGHVSDETRETHPELADPDRPNLPAGGTFQEFDVPEWQPEGAWQEGQFRFEEQPPGTWMWPL